MAIEDQLAIIFSTISIILGIITAIINLKNARDAKECVRNETKRLIEKHEKERSEKDGFDVNNNSYHEHNHNNF